MKYLEKRKGHLFVSKNIPISSDKMMIVSYRVDKEKLIENEEFEELIELQKMKHFSMHRALEFWDNFDYSLYTKILKARSNE